MFGRMLDSVKETTSNFLEDPIGTSVDIALEPVRNAVDVVDGLTEGEIRHVAALKLGADVVAGMALSEILDAIDIEELLED